VNNTEEAKKTRYTRKRYRETTVMNNNSEYQMLMKWG